MGSSRTLEYLETCGVFVNLQLRRSNVNDSKMGGVLIDAEDRNRKLSLLLSTMMMMVTLMMIMMLLLF